MQEEVNVTWPEAGKVLVSDSCRTDITYLGVCVPDGKAVLVELNPEQVAELIELLGERLDQHFADDVALLEEPARERHLRLV